MRMNKTLAVSLVALLLISMAVVVSSTPWDGVPDDPTPAQAIWVDPKNTTGYIGETFVVDVLVNITDPDPLSSPPDGMFGFEYKLRWNSTLINTVNITYHIPPGWNPYLVVINQTTHFPNGTDSHYLAITALLGAPAFTGVTSLCTYTFHVMGAGSCALDIYFDRLIHDLGYEIPHTTVDGYAILVPKVYVDPETSHVAVGQTFSINVSVANVTGLYAFEFKLLWNTTLLDCINATINRLWYPDDYVAKDELWDNYNATHGMYWCAYTAVGFPPYPPTFNGTTTMASLNLEATALGGCTLDLHGVTLAAANTTHAWAIGNWLKKDSPFDGYVTQPGTLSFSVTWKWLDADTNPVWLTADVTVLSNYTLENFSFNRSLGQISFSINATSGFCNVTVPKLLMDGAFKVLVNDTQVPTMLTWNRSHTFIYFAYSQGFSNAKIIGELVTRIRGPDLLTLVDVNGDGTVDIVDIVTLVLRFGWEEDC